MEEKNKDSGTMTVDPEQLEKSWDESVANLRDLLKSDEESNKKVKAAANADEDHDDDDEEGEEEEVQKSLSDFVAEDDSEAEIAMDVEPFLKSLVNGLEKYFEGKITTLQKSVKRIEALSKAQAQTSVSGYELQKAIDDKIQKIGEQSVGSSSKLRKSGARFSKKDGEDAGVGYNPQKVLQKSFVLLQKGQISPMQATKVEARVTRKMELPPDVAHLFDEKEE